jgi:hypothetical protein
MKMIPVEAVCYFRADDKYTAAVCDDAGRVSLRLRNRNETLQVSRIYADLFRQM